MKKQQLIEMIKRIIREEKSKKIVKENLNPSSWVSVVWDMSYIPEPLAFIISDTQDSTIHLVKGEIADLLQNKLRKPISPDDFEIESPMKFSEFQEEYGNVNNPRRININNYPHIEI